MPAGGGSWRRPTAEEWATRGERADVVQGEAEQGEDDGRGREAATDDGGERRGRRLLAGDGRGRSSTARWEERCGSAAGTGRENIRGKKENEEKKKRRREKIKDGEKERKRKVEGWICETPKTEEGGCKKAGGGKGKRPGRLLGFGG